MKLFQKHQEKVEDQGLVLDSPEGEPWLAFPAAVVNPLRRMVSRVLREGGFPKQLALVASLRQEGVTYISRALGATMAHDLDAAVCVVELNWWWPSCYPEALVCSGGLAAMLTGSAALADVIVKTGKENLSILPAGILSAGERTSFSRSSILHEVVAELSTRYQYLLLDIPAVLATSDAIPLASLGSACCLVIHHGATSIPDIRGAVDDISHLKQIGVVINKYQIKTPHFPIKYLAS